MDEHTDVCEYLVIRKKVHVESLIRELLSLSEMKDNDKDMNSLAGDSLNLHFKNKSIFGMFCLN